MKNKTTPSKLFFELGFYLLVLFSFAVYKNIENIKWLFIDSSVYKTTRGEILQSSMYNNGLYGGWRFSIQYDYEIEGKNFVSDRVHYGYQALSDRTYAQEYVNKYFVGKEVIVYYNPTEWEKSVLEPEVKWEGLINFIIIYILIDITLFGFSIFYFTKSRKSKM